ncbi:timeless protein-domain-containing protein [Lentinula aff. detonsa]|nr:timeless protein-domain-containing protein [Lentinula aff. detonsa]
MDDNEIIDISPDESENADPESPQARRQFLEPIVQRVVGALGGHSENGYRMGDQVNGCLKDLKKLWRQDETDDDRTVARMFWETRVLLNDLVPVLLVTAGQGFVEDKRAIACVDLMTAMTWPIDMAEELKELDDELDSKADYTELLQSHLHYKAAILKPGVLEALFGIALLPLTKKPNERTERDGQIVNVVLHLVRNLAFIKDLPANMFLSADHAQFSTMQSKFIRMLSDSHMLQLVLTIAANSDNDPLFDGWNTIVLEIIYLLSRGVQPSSLSLDQSTRPAADLQRLLAQEERSKRQTLRQAPTRHSRFGTTISVKLNPNKKQAQVTGTNVADATGSSEHSKQSHMFVIHRQEGITGETGALWDKSKRQKAWKGHKVDELASHETLSVEARRVLQEFASEFLEECFNSFLSTLLKDIRAERAKITEKDNLRLLYVTKWFLDFFLSRRSLATKSKLQAVKSTNTDEGLDSQRYGFGLVAEVLERPWIIWVLKRMREAADVKPKAWTELQAGIECLTELLLLIDSMFSVDISDSTLSEAAEILQQQLIYSGEVLDVTLESLRSYKEGTQSLVYLNSSVHLAYVLLKMLEKWAKGKGQGEVYVRKKKTAKGRKKRAGRDDEVPDEEEPQEQEDDDVVHETMFTFEAFEMKFAQADITHTLLVYLSRYNDFTNSEQMRRVVSLLHRQAVRAKAEGLFFKVSTLNLFKTILADKVSFPSDQPYKDLVNLINYILRQFFKALEQEPFLAVEAFFPKNRGNWKQYSSWEPPSKGENSKTVKDNRLPQEVQIKKGYSWSDQVGIAIAALVEAGQTELVLWTQEVLQTAKAARDRIIEEVDKKDDVDSDEDINDPNTRSKLLGPSVDAQAKLTDYLIPYLSDEHADAATKNPNLKLLFRLCKCYILDEDAEELEWYVPAAILPTELHSMITVITQFLETPFDLEGKKAAQLMSKKSRRRRRVKAPESDADEDEDEQEPRKRKRKEKQTKEEVQYKSAQFIEDSDAEYGDINSFLELEKKRREKAENLAAALGEGKSGTMKSTGTKKRRRKTGDKGKSGIGKKKRKGEKDALEVELDPADSSQSLSLSSEDEPETRSATNGDGERLVDDRSEVPTERSRPRPKPKPKVNANPPLRMDSLVSQSSSPSPSRGVVEDQTEDDDASTKSVSRRTKGRLILSDEDE